MQKKVNNIFFYCLLFISHGNEQIAHAKKCTKNLQISALYFGFQQCKKSNAKKVKKTVGYQTSI